MNKTEKITNTLDSDMTIKGFTAQGRKLRDMDFPESGLKLTDNVNYYLRSPDTTGVVIERSGQAYFEILDNWDNGKLYKTKTYKILALDKNKLLICEISFEPKKKLNEEDIKRMLEKVRELSKASDVYMVQNSPHKQILPTSTEKSMAKKFVKVGDVLNLNVVDQMIVSNHEYFSFKENGLNEEL